MADLLPGREVPLGKYTTVQRMLPHRERRTVGAWCFLDHFGPQSVINMPGMQVPPHPHMGLQTVTWLLEGEVLHRDSLGSLRTIHPGQLNLMTSGHGIAHSEESPKDHPPSLHGLQLWVALPKPSEEVEPSFQHHPAETIPALDLAGAKLRVVAGSAYGATSPVHVLSPLFYVDARLDRGIELTLPDEWPERAVYVVEGVVALDGEPHGPGTMIVMRADVPACISAIERAHVMVLGGAPLDGERHVWWNFVSSSRARIERAKADWRSGSFPTVPGDETEFIPLPD